MRGTTNIKRFCAASLTLLALFVVQAAGAQPAVSYDTVSTRRIGPGMVHHQVVEPTVPWELDVLEVDLTNPFLKMETADAQGSETVGSMAARNDSVGHRVVGAINGDFYGGGRPIGFTVQDGKLYHADFASRPAFGFDVEDHVMMNLVNFSGSVAVNGKQRTINDVNKTRGKDELILYNQFAGSSTGANQYGTEVVVRPVNRWIVNEAMQVTVQSVRQGAGDTMIPAGGAVLSGHGTAAKFLNDQVSTGDTLQLDIQVRPGLDRLDDMIAGNPFLVQDGNVVPGSSPREPRTAVGFSKDSTHFYMVTVDGRQNASVGMTFAELGDFMKRIGAHTAMNLDGGGSSTMLVRGDVVNSPSGGKQRAISSNALLAVSTAPQGALAHIQVTPTYQKIFRGRAKRFEVRGADQYYNMVALDTSKIAYSVDPGLGVIDAQGRFVASTEADTGNVYVRYGGLRDTARVVVKTIARFTMTPRDVVTDTTRPLHFKIASFDADGLQQTVERTQFTWTSTQPDVGAVDSTGRFRGRSEGTTRVVASYRGLTDTVRVRVEVQTGTNLVSALDEASDWQLSGENMNLDETQLSVSKDQKTQGQGALKLDYTYPSEGLHYLTMAAIHSVAGVPDTLLIDARSSNTAYNQVQVDVKDAQGHLFRLFSTSFANQKTFKTLAMVVDDAAPQKGGQGTMYFPIQIQDIRVQLRGSAKGDETSYSGTLYLDNLRVKYANRRTAVSKGPSDTSSFQLLPSYPNPFRDHTTITYKLGSPQHVRLIVYNVLGRRVLDVVDEQQRAGRHQVQLEGQALPAGVYFYRVQTKRGVQTGKVTKIK